MRPPDWPERLATYVADAQKSPFRWGDNDCCTFARGAVLAIGGPDLGVGWVDSYGDDAGADAAIRAIGSDLIAAMSTVCLAAGLRERQTPAMAQRGDLLVLRHPALMDGVQVAAICLGRDAVAPTYRRLMRLPMRVAVKAWAI